MSSGLTLGDASERDDVPWQEDRALGLEQEVVDLEAVPRQVLR